MSRQLDTLSLRTVVKMSTGLYHAVDNKGMYKNVLGTIWDFSQARLTKEGKTYYNRCMKLSR